MIGHALPPLLMWLRERARQSVCQHSVSNCLHQIALAFTQMGTAKSDRERREGEREREREGEVGRHQGRRGGAVRLEEDGVDERWTEVGVGQNMRGD